MDFHSPGCCFEEFAEDLAQRHRVLVFVFGGAGEEDFGHLLGTIVDLCEQGTLDQRLESREVMTFCRIVDAIDLREQALAVVFDGTVFDHFDTCVGMDDNARNEIRDWVLKCDDCALQPAVLNLLSALKERKVEVEPINVVVLFEDSHTHLSLLWCEEGLHELDVDVVVIRAERVALVCKVFTFIEDNNWFASSQNTSPRLQFLHDLPHVGKLCLTIEVHTGVLEFHTVVVTESSVAFAAEAFKHRE